MLQAQNYSEFHSAYAESAGSMASWQSAYPALSGDRPAHSLFLCAVVSSAVSLLLCCLCVCCLLLCTLLSCAFHLCASPLCSSSVLSLCALSSFVRFSSALFISLRSSSSLLFSLSALFASVCFSMLLITHAAAATLAEWTYIIISPRAVYFGTLDHESDKTFAILVFSFTALSYMFSVLFKWQKGAKSDKMWSITGTGTCCSTTRVLSTSCTLMFTQHTQHNTAHAAKHSTRSTQLRNAAHSQAQHFQPSTPR